MAHKGPVGIKALSAAILFSPSLSLDYTSRASSNEFSCPAAGSTDTCTLICDVAVGKDDPINYFTLDCGNAEQCFLECSESKCMQNGTMNANQAGSLNVNSTGSECLKYANIALPDNGNATFSMEQKGLSQMIVNAGSNTQSIVIDCTHDDAKINDECKGILVHAASAQYLEIRAGAYSEIGNQGKFEESKLEHEAHIWCPQNSLYSGSEPAACIIDLSGGGIINNSHIHTLYGIPQDVWVKIGLGTFGSNVEITCEGDNVPSVNSAPYSWLLSPKICWNSPSPTTDPTALYTSYPSRSPTVPTVNPTQSPSSSPSGSPARSPTMAPSKGPTQSPVTEWTPCIDRLSLYTSDDVDNANEAMISLDITEADKKLRLRLVGPSNKWFGIGFGSHVMENTYAITVSGARSDAQSVTQRILGYENEGVELTGSLLVESVVDDGKSRNVTVIIGWNGWYDFTNFLRCLNNKKKLPIIWAHGARENSDLEYHGTYKNDELVLLSCACDDDVEESGANYKHVKFVFLALLICTFCIIAT